MQFRICLRPDDPDFGNCPYDDFQELTKTIYAKTYVLANFIEFNNTINDIDNPVIFSVGGELEEVSGGIDESVGRSVYKCNAGTTYCYRFLQVASHSSFVSVTRVALITN